jgi:FixJ family two-component response regulator
MNSRTEQGPTVIVIDDDGAVREALSNLFRSIGLQVKVFASASEFLKSKLSDGPCWYWTSDYRS